MLCQNCQKRPANVHFTQMINGNMVEMYLCEQCANEKGQLELGTPLSISDFFSGLMGLAASSPYVASPARQVQACGKCGLTFEEFQKAGRLGCGNCYEVFRDKLSPLVKRLHGTEKHNGKVPGKVNEKLKAGREIELLKEQLNKAIKLEEYEKAAELRDRIKAAENKK